MNSAQQQGHWLVLTNGVVTGCHCGFYADMDADHGFGDSVIAHVWEVAQREALEQAANLLAEEEYRNHGGYVTTGDASRLVRSLIEPT